MKGLFIPEITAEMFRNGCLESIEALMAEGEIYDIDYQQPCEDAISREAVLNLFRPSKELQDSTLSKHWFDFVSKYINKIPSIKPQPLKGKWIVTEDDLDGINFPSFSCECSECGADFSWKTNFCPNCGSVMEVDKESEMKLYDNNDYEVTNEFVSKDAIREAIKKMEGMRDKDKIAEYPYNRCIKIIREVLGDD